MTMRRFGLATLVASACCLAPTESQAFWNWFRGCCGGTAVAAAPAPPVVTPAVAMAPSCDPCRQTVAYVPQTSYRVQQVAVPVTTYRPVTSCGLCGTSNTTYVPVTTYQTQTQYAPYTSYRLVYSNALPVASTSYYTPVTTAYATSAAVSYAAPAASATSSCCSGSAVAAPTTTYETPSYAAPSSSYTPPAGSYSPGATYAPAPTAVPNGTAAPTLPPATSTPSTYADQPTPAATAPVQSEPQQKAQEEERLHPIPDVENRGEANPTTGPNIVSPDSRTTRRSASDRFASLERTTHTVARPVSTIDDGGWRPSR